MQDRNRFDAGMEVLKQVGGADYAGPLDALKDTAPELVRYTIEFAYGEVMSRPALDLKTRQLATVAALAGMARAQPQLRFHINGALNVGCSPEDIIAMMLLAAVYAGVPAALNGAAAAREIFEQRGFACTPLRKDGGSDHYGDQMRALGTFSAAAGADLARGLPDIAPELARVLDEFSSGTSTAAPRLESSVKELCTIALLTALGTAQPQLKAHIGAALEAGAAREQIVEVIQQMAVYAGFPAALNGIGAAKQVFTARAAKP